MLTVYLVLLLAQISACLGKISQASIIDNELVSDPIVNCEETMVAVTFKTKKPFNGRVYVQGMADDDRCSRNFATNSDQSKFSMMIQNGDCTMQRQRVTGTLEGMMLSLTIVVSFHGTFVTKSDRAYRCMCFFKNIKHLTNVIDVNLIGTTELLDTAKTPSCVYSIHTKSPDGPLVGLSQVGEKIFHVWECDDRTHDFLVHSCSVEDGKGFKFNLLDVDGCAIDPIIQPDVVYDENNRASVETFGYKFSDTSILNYQCTIELCKKSTNECDGLSPPICGRNKRDTITARRSLQRRTRHSINTTLTKQIDLLTSLKILDNIYENSLGANASALSNKSKTEITKSVELLSLLAPQLINNNYMKAENSLANRNFLLLMLVAFSVSLIAVIAFIMSAVFIIFRRKFSEADLKKADLEDKRHKENLNFDT